MTNSKPDIGNNAKPKRGRPKTVKIPTENRFVVVESTDTQEFLETLTAVSKRRNAKIVGYSAAIGNHGITFTALVQYEEPL